MKAVLVDEQTKKLSIGEYENTVLGEGELRVSVKATAINRADLLQKLGQYPPPEGASPILGLEMAGMIKEVGPSVKGWEPGDRICALLPGGGYAEEVVIPAEMAIRIPERFSYEEAAAIPEVFLTAYLNLFVLGGLKQGQNVLIHAGASGVGTAAIQLVREAGAKSIVTAGSQDKLDFCAKLGADYGINYRTDSFSDKVKEYTNGNGVNLILDFVGASYYERNLESVSKDGKIIFIGTMGGGKIEGFNIMQLMMKRISLIGSTLRSQSQDQKIELTKKFTDFSLALFEEGRLKPIIDSVWDIHEVNEAHDKMQNNLNKGKIVLRMDF
ncbi:NAD(P)H-quinone oxidoreductase [Heyndrickxia acidicola]|uniref:NAD(P)H-quinone oxidoreductase n=1 Tax=Heyndrickxia acidicola TaxID=209389 RepID=A0ABU6MD52_9BACI|nr:NAD(P)H-quinone oxidoreductase [Heyndrickxia acidicola]MED1202591.1 NAD(P)H-quinone oxidoreductase [Heyndrickxia acidicola]